MATAHTVSSIPWWKEPTKDQWLAWWAAWLGWTLDAFDFTVFLLIMVPIAKEFDVPLTDVALVFTLTLWMRLVGAVELVDRQRTRRIHNVMVSTNATSASGTSNSFAIGTMIAGTR